MAKKDIVKKKKGEVIKEAKIENNQDNKKIQSYILLGIMFLVLTICGVYWFINKDNNVIDVNVVNFKEEYESLNGQETKYGKYLEINIDKNNVIKYSNYKEVFDVLENKSGVIYFGFPECPWCRNLAPVLVDAANETGIDKVYYLNNKEDRDIKSLDDNKKVITEKEGTDNYYKLVEKLDSVLGSYEGIDEDSKRLYFPTVIFVKDGKIVDSHIGTVDSHTNGSQALTDEQKEELKKTLIDKINKTILCDSAC